MSAATLPPSVKEKPTDISLEESSGEGDELPSEAAVAALRRAAEGEGQGEGDGGGGCPEEVRRYSRDQLLEMRSLPLSKRRPDFLPEIYCSVSSWDGNKKRSETPNDDDRGGRDNLGDKRRSGDPRERIRKESEGIVLSPQRRSFNSGCFVVAGSAPGGGGGGAGGALGPNLRETRLRPDSPISYDRDGKSDMNSRDGGRRIGSGRIMAREMVPWERGNSEVGDTNDHVPYRTPRERGDDRYERRSFGRDMYGNSDKNRIDRDRMDRDREIGDTRFSDRRDRDDNRRNNNNRYNDRRRFDKDEEPEWYSGGPTSQHDTIELRGFDDPSAPSGAKSGEGAAPSGGPPTGAPEAAPRTRPARRSAGSGRTPSAVAANQVKETPKLSDKFGEEREVQSSVTASSPIPGKDTTTKENNFAPKNEEDSGKQNDGGEAVAGTSDFNLEDFLKLDTIPGLLPNGGSDEVLSGGSRFSQWFRRESPTPAATAPNMDAPEHLLANIINEPSISIPSGESPHLFAPISPAASTTNSLLEMLQRGQQQSSAQHHYHHKPAMEMPSNIHSLEELEARMLGNVQQQQQQQQQQQHMQHLQQQQHQHRAMQQHQHQPPHNDDVISFKKMMAQAMPASNGPSSKSQQQPMSLLQMLSKSQQADQAAMEAQHQAPSVPQDVLFKVFQAQQNRPQEHPNKMMSGNVNHSSRHYQVSPIPNDLQTYMNNLQPSQDLLLRPEAQTIMQGLKQGELTPQHLVQQISNPGLQSRQRDMLASILKVHEHSRPPHPAHLALPPQQQLRVSPLPPNAMQSRIPSPRELQQHTQIIMQGALIKKKLEEQRENFRRRQEQQMAASSPTKHQLSVTSFTPTAVLRKMMADKEPEPPGPNGAKASGWGAPPTHILPQPVAPKHGRPIVKQGNGGGMGVPGGYQPPPADFPPQQFVNHHSQQQYMQSIQLQQIARGKMPSGVGVGNQQQLLMQRPHHQLNNNMGGASFHQLFAHHRNHNDGGHSMGPALSPTSNQLAQWFSPELLAQATAGKLPSVNLAPNVLSLEELERIQHNEAIVRN